MFLLQAMAQVFHGSSFFSSRTLTDCLTRYHLLVSCGATRLKGLIMWRRFTFLGALLLITWWWETSVMPHCTHLSVMPHCVHICMNLSRTYKSHYYLYIAISLSRSESSVLITSRLPLCLYNLSWLLKRRQGHCLRFSQERHKAGLWEGWSWLALTFWVSNHACPCT